MKKVNLVLLEEIRIKKLGYLSIPEISAMFGIGRKNIDDALNKGEIDYISPNNRDRFVILDNFMAWQKGKPKLSKEICNEKKLH